MPSDPLYCPFCNKEHHGNSYASKKEKVRDHIARMHKDRVVKT